MHLGQKSRYAYRYYFFTALGFFRFWQLHIHSPMRASLNI